MKNLSAINHNRFSQIFEVTNNYNKAMLLDKLIYWWQISTYTLPNSPHIWFTRSREQIANESELSIRSVDRFLNEFTKAGLIEKTNKLFIKKHLYIRITDKLLVTLGLSNQETPDKIQPSSYKVKQSETQLDYNEQRVRDKDSSDLTQFGSIDFANLAVSIYKDQDNNLTNSIVNDNDNVNNINPQPLKTKNLTTSKQYSQLSIEKITDEQLTPQFTNYIKGTIKNLKNQHGLNTSSPEQLFAEVIFSVLNKQHQFVGIEDNVHRLNLIAKLLRENRWRTPKGFFNHSETGKIIKKSLLENESARKKNKKVEVPNEDSMHLIVNPGFNGAGQVELKRNQQELQNIQNLIVTETRYFNEMKQIHNIKPSKITQMVIDSTAIKIEDLRKQKKQLDDKLKFANAA